MTLQVSEIPTNPANQVFQEGAIPGERKIVVLVARMKRGATTDINRRATMDTRYPPFLALLRPGRFGGLFLNAIRRHSPATSIHSFR